MGRVRKGEKLGNNCAWKRKEELAYAIVILKRVVLVGLGCFSIDLSLLSVQHKLGSHRNLG